eukprot:scaffold68773_cov17-Tisochrysis_lutea.AAC.2
MQQPALHPQGHGASLLHQCCLTCYWVLLPEARVYFACLRPRHLHSLISPFSTWAQVNCNEANAARTISSPWCEGRSMAKSVRVPMCQGKVDRRCSAR